MFVCDSNLLERFHVSNRRSHFSNKIDHFGGNFSAPLVICAQTTYIFRFFEDPIPVVRRKESFIPTPLPSWFIKASKSSSFVTRGPIPITHVARKIIRFPSIVHFQEINAVLVVFTVDISFILQDMGVTPVFNLCPLKNVKRFCCKRMEEDNQSMRVWWGGGKRDYLIA